MTTSINNTLPLLFKAFLIFLAFNFVPMQSAEAKLGFDCKKNYAPDSRAGGKCKRCGGKNQPACEPLRKGKQCNKGLKKIKGICLARGGDGETPRKGIGFKCNKDYAPDSRYGNACKPCGRKNQPACEKLRKGAQCFNYTEKSRSGICIARGGNNQPPYSKGIFKCKPGYATNTNKKKTDRRCEPCGGKNQVTCEPARKGKVCRGNLDAYMGMCRAYGQKGQQPWPKTRHGYPCDRGLITRDNVCVTCGGKDQPACRAMQKGPRCHSYLAIVDGYCREGYGGEGDKRYKGIGFDCKPGYNKDPNNKKRCTACGGLNQVVCETFRQGKRCKSGLKPERVKVKRGKDWKKCVPDETSEFIKELSQEATNKLKTHATDLLELMILSRNTSRDNVLQSELTVAAMSIKQKSLKKKSGILPAGQPVNYFTFNEGEIPDNNACGSSFESWSLGLSAEAKVLAGISGEAGMVFRCTDHQSGQKDAKLYSSTSETRSLGAGGAAGATIGLWKDSFDNIAGPSHGFTISIMDALDTIKTLKDASNLLESIKNMASIAPDLAIGFWWYRNDDTVKGRFLGLTITLSGGAGLDAGGVYSKTTTYQFDN